MIRKDSYPVPAVFGLLADKGEIEPEMMYNTFNMGIGMVMAVEPRVTMFDRPEVGGTHMEQNILVTEDGYELLSKKLRFDEALLAD